MSTDTMPLLADERAERKRRADFDRAHGLFVPDDMKAAKDDDERRAMQEHNLNRYAQARASSERYEALKAKHGATTFEELRAVIAAEALDVGISAGKLSPAHRAPLLAILRDHGEEAFFAQAAAVRIEREPTAADERAYLASRFPAASEVIAGAQAAARPAPAAPARRQPHDPAHEAHEATMALRAIPADQLMPYQRKGLVELARVAGPSAFADGLAMALEGFQLARAGGERRVTTYLRAISAPMVFEPRHTTETPQQLAAQALAGRAGLPSMSAGGAYEQMMPAQRAAFAREHGEPAYKALKQDWIDRGRPAPPEARQ